MGKRFRDANDRRGSSLAGGSEVCECSDRGGRMKVTAPILLAGALIAASSVGAWGWQSGAVNYGTAVDPQGDVIGWSVGNSGTDLVKLSGRDGVELWRTPPGYFHSTGEIIGHIAVDGSGDVLIVMGAQVFKLSGASGAELWQRGKGCAAGATVQDQPLYGLSADATGNFVVFGYICDRLGVSKLSGASGETLWTREFAFDIVQLTEVGSDSLGNLVVHGVPVVPNPHGSVVMKLAGGDGGTLWSRAVFGPNGAGSFVLDAAGNVILTAGGTWEFGVLKLSGDNGRTLWYHAVRGTRTPFPYRFCEEDEPCVPYTYVPQNAATVVTVAPRGDVIAAGILDNKGTNIDFFVTKLSGTTGKERWRKTVAGAFRGNRNVVDYATAIAVDASGDVFTAGNLHINDPCGGTGTPVSKLSGRTGQRQWRIYECSTVAPILVDPAGDVVFGRDVGTVKVRGADGGDFVQ